MAFILLIPISNIHAFEYDLYDDFFISYGKCNSSIEAENELFQIMLSKIISENLENSFCTLIENSRFEYDYLASDGIWTKKIKFEKEEPIRFFTSSAMDGYQLFYQRHEMKENQ